MALRYCARCQARDRPARYVTLSTSEAAIVISSFSAHCGPPPHTDHFPDGASFQGVFLLLRLPPSRTSVMRSCQRAGAAEGGLCKPLSGEQRVRRAHQSAAAPAGSQRAVLWAQASLKRQTGMLQHSLRTAPLMMRYMETHRRGKDDTLSGSASPSPPPVSLLVPRPTLLSR